MRVVLTGGTGFLGKRVEERYRREWEILTPSRWELDITDWESVLGYLEKAGPDAVIHCAAISSVAACEQEPEASRQVNVAGSEHIAAAARALGAACLLCSSDQVYFGAPGPQPHKEAETLSPGNVYGRQKLTMERRCLRRNPDCVALRLSWMYDTRRIGCREHGNFLETLREDLAENRPFRFPVYDRRGITDVNTVVENLGKALSLPGGVYNFGSSCDSSTYEMMCRVLSRCPELGPLTVEKNIQAFRERPRNLAMDMTKTEAAGIFFPSTEAGLVPALKQLIL